METGTHDMDMDTEPTSGVEGNNGGAEGRLVRHAISEFLVAAQHRDHSQLTEDMLPWIERIESAVVQMLAVLDGLSTEDRSRWLAMSLLGRLSTFQVITPLTGEESEWQDSGAEGMKVNRRCPHVFLRDDGTAFDSRAVVHLVHDGEGGVRAGSVEQRDITFPYTPKQEVVQPQAPESVQDPQTQVPVGAP